MSAARTSTQWKNGTAQRSLWAAGFLSLLTPGLGQLYNGRPLRALAAIALVLAGQAVILAASLLPPETPSTGYLQLGLLGLGLLIILAIAVDAAVGARRAGRIAMRRFNHALVYILAILVWWFGEIQAFGRIQSTISASTSYAATAGAMEPTLMRDDFVFAYRGYYAMNPPQRGDVVAMRKHGSKGDVSLLRVVGLPGDRVRIEDGAPVLNGGPVAHQPIEDPDQTNEEIRKAFSIVAETLPDGVTYRISEQSTAAGFADNTPEQVVPDGTVYLLGDNRDKATDSRIFGPVPITELESRLTFIFWSREDARIGTTVQPQQ